ncbi:MAG TPA: glutamate decarboxylase [Candidatus Anoxymicrobiaceae bacterium]
MISKKVPLGKDDSPDALARTYSTRYFVEDIPKYKMPDKGMPAEAAFHMIMDELNLEGNPPLNLASFVTTWMEPQAEALIAKNNFRNFIDREEYPQTGVIHDRTVNMIARLYHAPEELTAVGTSAIGSSEAIMLGLLAHKWNWRKKREAAGKPTDRPNLVLGANTHIVWDKFARYFDVEPRVIPMRVDRYTITAEEVEALVDENTIAVGAVVGTTFTGEADPVKEINDMLEDVLEKKGWDIPIHVDGASGGFTTPFLHPDLEWDFRLPHVKSINASGHKYGLVYPGVGWLIFRDQTDLPEDLVFSVNYLGGEEETFTLNFSKAATMVLAQYYNFIRLGFDGYKRIMETCMENAKFLMHVARKGGRAESLVPIEKLFMPVLVFKAHDRNVSGAELSAVLRQSGWIVPAYTLPPNAQSVEVMRVVVRESFSRDMAEMLVDDMRLAYAHITGEPLVPKAAKKAQSQRGGC